MTLLFVRNGNDRMRLVSTTALLIDVYYDVYLFEIKPQDVYIYISFPQTIGLPCFPFLAAIVLRLKALFVVCLCCV